MADDDGLRWVESGEPGVRIAWLTDPNKSTLRGKRLRRAFDRPAPVLDTWPAPWRELLALWIRRAEADKRYKRDGLLTRAGATRANVALTLFDRLLADGLIEIEEHRDPKLGWQLKSIRFPAPIAIRSALALPEPDAAEQTWNRRKDTHLVRPDLDAARAALDDLPFAAAINRLELLEALDRWAAEGRDTGSATRRDFALFARGDTKNVSDAEWRWLAEALDLPAYGIAAHAPLLLIAAPCKLATATGTLDLAAAGGFLGLPPRAIHATRAIHDPPACWRLVENRSAFEKAAAARAPRDAVLWLPGYPPGWWRTAVARLLALAPAPAHIACDPDPDGIAIALQASGVWHGAALPWSPWRMTPTDLQALSARRPLTARDRILLDRLRSRSLPPALEALAAEIAETGEKGEQEGLFW